MRWSVALVAMVFLVMPYSVMSAGEADLTSAAFPWVIRPDTPVRGVVQLFNEGSPITAACDVDFYLDGQLFQSHSTDGTGDCNGGWAWHAPPLEGLHTFQAIADPRDRIAETNETNNVYTLQRIYTDNVPDITSRIVSVDAPRWPSSELEVSYVVCNEGVAANMGPIESQVLLHQSKAFGLLTRQFHGTSSHGVLQPGTCEDVLLDLRSTSVFGLAPPLGDFEVFLSANEPYEVPLRERTEDNNGDHQVVFIGP